MTTFQKNIRTILILIVLTCTVNYTFGQEATPKNNKANRTSKLIQEKAGRPDVPGDLMIEFGYNWVQEHPVGYGFKTISSRTFNAYYLYDVGIGESSFSFHPGIGIGTEKYAFDKNITLAYGMDSLGGKQVQFTPLDSIYGSGAAYKKSQLSASYVDIPLEIRWLARKYDPKSSFKITLGAKVGFLIDSKTKVKYRADGETKITKQKENYQLAPIRYGAYTKIGFGGFSAFYYYSLSDLFRKNKGPMATTMYPMTFGLSLALF